MSLAISVVSCSNGQTVAETTTTETASGQKQTTALLPPADFNKKMAEMPDAPVLDVRTPGEFSGGHIAKSKNVDWNGGNFDKQVATLDKEQAVFVYCRSGGRSASAVSKLQSMGFAQIYELAGGIMSWQGASMPVE